MEKIDVIKMVRKIRDEQYEKTKGKSRKELLAYFHEQAQIADAEAKKLLASAQQS